MKNRHLIINIGLSIFLLMHLSGCAMLPFKKAETKEFSPRLYRGVTPDLNKLSELRQLDIKTWVSFDDDYELTKQSRELAKQNGFNFVSIPIGEDDWIKDEAGLKFLELALSQEYQPIYFFCKDGKQRTGAMVSIYRVIVNGWGPKEAYREAKRFGYWPYVGEAQLKKYIHQLRDREVYYNYLKGKQ